MDDLGDEYSAEVVVDTSAKPDMARQEFKDEADMNKLLYRYGVGLVGGQRKATWGQEVDFDLDLQTALGAVADAKRAWSDLPPNLRAAYPSWQELLNALESGQLRIKPEEELPPAEVVSPPVVMT